MANKIETDTVTLPAYWASALVNGDTSGMNETEISAMNAKLAQLDGWVVEDVARDETGEPQESRFTWSYDLYSGTDIRGGDVLDYVVRRARYCD